MAELADAADSKSAEVYPSWGFDPPSRHHAKPPLEASSNHKRCRSLLRDWAAPISWSPEIVKQ